MRNIWTLVHFFRTQALSDPACAGLAPPLREALGFRHVLRNLPIGVPPDGLADAAAESLAGDFGWACLSGGERARLEEAVKRWEKSRPAPTSPPPPTPAALLRDRFHCFGGYTTAHTCADYERVITEGLSGILQQIERRRPASGAPPTSGADTTQPFRRPEVGEDQ